MRNSGVAHELCKNSAYGSNLTEGRIELHTVYMRAITHVCVTQTLYYRHNFLLDLHKIFMTMTFASDGANGAMSAK